MPVVFVCGSYGMSRVEDLVGMFFLRIEMCHNTQGVGTFEYQLYFYYVAHSQSTKGKAN